MSVAIIGGTGDEGFGLAVRLGRAGEHVIIGSRSDERGRAAAEKAKSIAGASARVDGASNETAAAGSDLVLVTVPFAGQAEIYRSIKDLIDPYASVETQLEHRRAILSACEQTMERLADDPHYFSRPERALFQDIRRYFPITNQAQVGWTDRKSVV